MAPEAEDGLRQHRATSESQKRVDGKAELVWKRLPRSGLVQCTLLAQWSVLSGPARGSLPARVAKNLLYFS